ncbi:hypothetical protein Syun_002328 [Stephania yunnanensis]|uniref:Uncharacterized protein n=1 Tax=Stephania yunnanensis TaxID=152371 RepID=A0AAP0LF97_9MAGN
MGVCEWLLQLVCDCSSDGDDDRVGLQLGKWQAQTINLELEILPTYKIYLANLMHFKGCSIKLGSAAKFQSVAVGVTLTLTFKG